MKRRNFFAGLFGLGSLFTLGTKVQAKETPNEGIWVTDTHWSEGNYELLIVDGKIRQKKYKDRIEYYDSELQKQKIIYFDGREYWYKDGKVHRTDGPAVIHANGSKYWYENGHFIRSESIFSDGTTIQLSCSSNPQYEDLKSWKTNIGIMETRKTIDWTLDV